MAVSATCMLDSLLTPSISTANHTLERSGGSVLYTPSLTQYIRRKTITVNIGDVPLGSDYPIRVQSMTTVDTMDTDGSIDQSIRMIDAGCEYVRITAPSVKEAQNLENIRKGLRARGYTTPLVADIHFTPNAAELAARIVEKVRINPGNYADRKRFDIHRVQCRTVYTITANRNMMIEIRLIPCIMRKFTLVGWLGSGFRKTRMKYEKTGPIFR